MLIWQKVIPFISNSATFQLDGIDRYDFSIPTELCDKVGKGAGALLLYGPDWADVKKYCENQDYGVSKRAAVKQVNPLQPWIIRLWTENSALCKVDFLCLDIYSEP